MKILVLSDSHGCLDFMRRAVEIEQPDAVCHLGDHARDAAILKKENPQLPVHVVRGNCDCFGNAPDEAHITLGGRPILMMHGHRYGVKSSPYRAILAARQVGAVVLLFGHTHRRTCFLDQNLWVMNPGSCMGSKPVSYGVIMIENCQITCQTHVLDG
ncbi:MAG: metallophosphoesterase [Oscillospiraceae bacterium]|nr:metallophosphoesterase [Oscillospiraceae bacterium]